MYDLQNSTALSLLPKETMAEQIGGQFHNGQMRTHQKPALQLPAEGTQTLEVIQFRDPMVEVAILVLHNRPTLA